MFVKEMLFLLGYKLCLLKIAIRREKFDKKVSENGVKVTRLRDRNSLDDRPDFQWRHRLCTARPVPGVLYCSVLFSDTSDCAENFHFEKNGGKYPRTEFWSGCIRRRWRRGQELLIRQRQWWRRFGRFWPRNWWKSSTPMPMACLSVTAASPTA